MKWAKIAVLLAALGIAYSAGYGKANDSWSVKWAMRNEADAVRTAQAAERERDEEQRRQAATNQEVINAEEKLSAALHDAAVAQSAADRLQSELTRITGKLADSETGKLSALAAASAARAETGVLLAQLLSESDKAAGEYAGEADRAYAAGQSCERIYNRVTTP